MTIHTMNMVLYAVLIPVGGLLSDRVGRLPVLSMSASAVVLLAWPLWALLSTKGSLMAAFEGQVGGMNFMGVQPEGKGRCSVSVILGAWGSFIRNEASLSEASPSEASPAVLSS